MDCLHGDCLIHFEKFYGLLTTVIYSYCRICLTRPEYRNIIGMTFLEYVPVLCIPGIPRVFINSLFVSWMLIFVLSSIDYMPCTLYEALNSTHGITTRSIK